MEARYTYRLRVTPRQATQLQEVFDSCRFVWNTALGRWMDLWHHEGVSVGWIDLSAELTDWRGRYEWLAAVPRRPQQQVLRSLGRSINAFFDKSNPVGCPRFKKKGSHATAEWLTNGFRLKGNRLFVAVAGGRTSLRVVWSRPLPSLPKSVTVYRDAAGRWWASFVVRIEPETLALSGRITGLDMGLTNYATTEFPAADVTNPRFARQAAKALARSQRNMDRKQKGSKGRVKAKAKTAKVHARVANQRADFVHKEARKLVRSFDRIGVEDLRIKNMSRRGKVGNRRRKAGLNRSIADAGWGDFLAALEWQAKKCGREVVRLNPRNTTQNCSACGTKAKVHVGLADRIFRCDFCGLVLDRDRNAAHNLNPGWAVPGVGYDGDKSSVPAGTEAA